MAVSNAIRNWRAIWNPDMYHGWGKQRRYFEGWYYKVVDRDQTAAYAFIPGISMDEAGQKHAFIQVMDGLRCTSSYHSFDVEAFDADGRHFEVRLGKSAFSSRHMHIELPNIRGQLTFRQTTPWPKMLGAPGIMGWYSFVPFMECYHGVVSLNHSIEGQLEIDQRMVSFDGGKGYIEKDWGRSFPKCWIWTQCNHFDMQEDASIMASVAHIPWLGHYFVGFIVGCWFDGRLYKFATYTGAKMRAALTENQVILAFKNRQFTLHITTTKGESASLLSPISGTMKGKINESLQAKMHVELKDGDTSIFSGSGSTAGLEVAGDIDILLTDQWRR